MTFSNSAAALISAEARHSADGKETGGILLGHDTGDRLHVVTAGGPGPAAQRSPHRFLRDLDHARTLADQAYDEDGSVWIGEWHTHPSGPARPSPLDLTTYTAHVANDSLGFDRFLACIVVPCANHGWAHVQLAAWVVTSTVAETADIEVEPPTGGAV